MRVFLNKGMHVGVGMDENIDVGVYISCCGMLCLLEETRRDKTR
jgi:hypothetical protein